MSPFVHIRPSIRARHNRGGSLHLAEQLEPRLLFVAVAWDGGGDGVSWNNPLNWSNNALPTIDDDVTINAADPNLTILSLGSISARNLTTSTDIHMRGQLTIHSSVTLNNASIKLGDSSDGNSSGTMRFTNTPSQGGSQRRLAL